MDKVKDYFTNDFSKEVWSTTYRAKGEASIDDTWKRVAKAVASVEQDEENKLIWEQRFYFLLKNFKLVPGGRILSNAGTGFTSTCVNCFVGTKPEVDVDSLEGICEILRTQMLTLASEGGYGLNFGFIRPRGGYVKKRGIRTPGAVKYMELFDKSSEIITEGAGDFELEYEKTEGKPDNEKKKIRKGAQIFLLPIWHPDIIEFIEAKRIVGRLTKANLSVQMTNEFMDRLIKVLNTDKSDPNYEELNTWQLIFPDTNHPKFKTDWYGNIVEWRDEKKLPVKVYKTIKLTDIWEKIMQSTYNYNDPGILFTDIANATNCASYLGKPQYIEASNPCIPAWSLLCTREGLKPLSDISIGDEIWSETGWTRVINKVSSGIKDVYKYKTTKGFIACTENHKLVQRGEKVEAKDCDSVDLLLGPTQEVVFNKQNIMDGLFFGDGYFHKASNNKPVLLIGQHDTDYFTSDIKDLILSKVSVGETTHEVITTIKPEEMNYTYLKVIPERFMLGDVNTKSSFLRGLYSANGSIVKNRITFKTASKNLRDQLIVLLSSLGIEAYYTTNKSKAVEFSNGTYTCKESYDVNILKMSSISLFKDKIGFIQQYKQDKLNAISKSNITKSKTVKIIETEYYSTEEVFDITVDNVTHTFWCNGFNISNCGEITMGAGSSCLLSSWNFTSYIKIDANKLPYFDFNEFKSDIAKGIRFMDNVATLTEMPLPEYKETITNYRRLGMGFMGLGSTLMILGLKYGSKESVEFTDKLLSLLNFEAIKASILLAGERGAYKDCDWQKHFAKVKQVFKFTPDQIEELNSCLAKAQGFRNVALFTVPPTGNTGCLANNVSGGVEPIFALTTYRLVGVPEIPEELKDKCPKFWEGDMTPNDYFKEREMWGVKYLEYRDPDSEVLYKIVKDRGLCKEVAIKDFAVDFIEKNNLDKNLIDESVTAMNLTVDHHINILNIVANHLDQSCSKTVNLPEDYKYTDMKNLYLDAYKTGRIKGITTFRSGTRMAVLTDKKSDSKDCPCIKKTTAVKRPKELPCKLHILNIKGISYYVIVSLLEDDPYEVFMAENSQDIIEDDEIVGHKLIFKPSMNNAVAKLIKKANKQYVFVTEDGFEYQISRKNESDERATITGYSRLLSTALRHGTPIKFLVEQMEKTEGSFAAPVKVIARVLKKYIRDGEEVKGEVCPECGGTLVRKEGCKSCTSCGWSACG